MIGVTILGSTGSIGINTLEVLSHHRERFRVVALTANKEVDRMARQCAEYRPEYAVMADTDAAGALRERLRRNAPQVEVLAGSEGLVQVASLEQADYVMAAIVGAAGLQPTLAAVRAGKRVLLANKEALVMSGGIMMREVEQNNAILLPIDSEHNAVFQCMPDDFVAGETPSGVKRILLTASGGPFRDLPLSALSKVTPEQACRHPNWDMGRKISVDSASMMNKGLEVIEACWLFHIPPDAIEVVVHRQSIVHSLVEYMDGSILAQLGNPDMRTPIAHALAWPERMASGVKSLDLFSIKRLDFQPAELERYPCLRIAYQAMREGGTATTVLNAANEVAVQAFLDGVIGFAEIPEMIENTLSEVPTAEAASLEAILEADRRARAAAEAYIHTAEHRVVQ